MQNNPKSMTHKYMTSRTLRAKQQVNDTLKRAKEIENDTRKDERKVAQRCKACFYFTGFAGAAMTMQPCMSCHSPEQYGSTNTDALCLSCAREFDLCKHCGGDLEMRERRREWPEPKIKPTSGSR